MLEKFDTVVDKALKGLKSGNIDIKTLVDEINSRKMRKCFVTEVYFHNETGKLNIRPTFNCLFIGKIENIGPKEKKMTESELRHKLIHLIEDDLLYDYTCKLINPSMIMPDDVFRRYTICIDDVYDIQKLIDIVCYYFRNNYEHYIDDNDVAEYFFNRISKAITLSLSKDSLNEIVLMISSSIKDNKEFKNLIPTNLLEYIKDNINDTKFYMINVLIREIDYFNNFLEQDIKKQLENDKNYIYIEYSTVYSVNSHFPDLISQNLIEEDVVPISSLKNFLEVERIHQKFVFDDKNVLEQCLNFIKENDSSDNKRDFLNYINSSEYIIDDSLFNVMIRRNTPSVLFKNHTKFKKFNESLNLTPATLL